jgi:general L-amino acid transport system ATP-binding protein
MPMRAPAPGPDPAPILVCEGVRRRFGRFEALRGVSLTVRRGQVVCIVGPSGSGKSTFLRTINALEPLDEGRIEVDGITLPGTAKDVLAVRRNTGMVFQSFNLFPHLTVRRNVTLAPMRNKGLERAAADVLAERLLARVHIADQIDKYPAQLSGGQQQRVAIARALAMEPRLLMFDEPTSALDPELVNEVLEVMRELAHSGITMLVVTHEMAFAREAADRIVFMADGVVVQDLPPGRFFAGAGEPRIETFLAKVR